MSLNSYLSTYLSKKTTPRSGLESPRHSRRPQTITKKPTVKLCVVKSVENNSNFISVTVPPKLVVKKKLPVLMELASKKSCSGINLAIKDNTNSSENDIKLPCEEDKDVKEAWIEGQNCRNAEGNIQNKKRTRINRNLLSAKMWKNPADSLTLPKRFKIPDFNLSHGHKPRENMSLNSSSQINHYSMHLDSTKTLTLSHRLNSKEGDSKTNLKHLINNENSDFDKDESRNPLDTSKVDDQDITSIKDPCGEYTALNQIKNPLTTTEVSKVDVKCVDAVPNSPITNAIVSNEVNGNKEVNLSNNKVFKEITDCSKPTEISNEKVKESDSIISSFELDEKLKTPPNQVIQAIQDSVINELHTQGHLNTKESCPKQGQTMDSLKRGSCQEAVSSTENPQNKNNNHVQKDNSLETTEVLSNTLRGEKVRV